MELNKERQEAAKAVIREKLKIREVIEQEHGVANRDVGMVSCLFHHEGIPSLSINNEKGVFYCFSCGVHGDVINLVKECQERLHKHRMSYAETIDFILAENPELAKELGFHTVFIRTEQKRTLTTDLDGNVILDIPPHYRPSPTPIDNYHTLGAKLQRAIAREGMTEELLNRVMLFIGACEVGYPIGLTKEILQKGVFLTGETKEAIELDEEELDAFSAILES